MTTKLAFGTAYIGVASIVTTSNVVALLSLPERTAQYSYSCSRMTRSMAIGTASIDTAVMHRTKKIVVVTDAVCFPWYLLL